MSTTWGWVLILLPLPSMQSASRPCSCAVSASSPCMSANTQLARALSRPQAGPWRRAPLPPEPWRPVGAQPAQGRTLQSVRGGSSTAPPQQSTAALPASPCPCLVHKVTAGGAPAAPPAPCALAPRLPPGPAPRALPVPLARSLPGLAGRGERRQRRHEGPGGAACRSPAPLRL